MYYLVHPETASYLLGFGFLLGVVACLGFSAGLHLARLWRNRRKPLPPPPPPPAPTEVET